MKKIFSIFLFLFLSVLSTDVFAITYVKDGGTDLTSEDSDACGIFDRGIANYKKDETFTFSKPGGYWLYTAADQHGNSGVCWNYTPTDFNFTYFKRTGDTNDNIEYVYRESTCAHRIPPSERAGYCWDTLTDGYIAKFAPADIVSKDSAAGNKTSYGGDWAPGSVICAKRIKPGEKYLHDSTDYDTKGTNDTGVNQICAYRVYAGNDTCNTPFPNWNGAYFGCVAEIPPPGPDVMNSVVPSNLTPVIHYKMCMDDQGNGRAGCDPSYLKLVGQGSTFDKPLVPLTDNRGGLLFLQYQFKDDISTDPKYHPTCANFVSSSQGLFDDATQYCAQVPKDDPSKVCACIKRNDGTDPLSLTHIDYCGSNGYIGCVDRPTLEHSKLKLVAEFVVSEDTLRNRQDPAIRPVFARTDSNGKVIYVDDSNEVVCQDPNSNMAWMKCQPDGTPTATAATGAIKIKERLKLPLDTVKIKEYTPAYFTGNLACSDSSNTAVAINYDGAYYTLDGSGVMTKTKASGSVSCAYNSAAVSLADVRPKQYLRDTEIVYGVKFNAMIPVIDTDKTIKYGKYTGPFEAMDAGTSCYALKTQQICSTQGKKAFYPAGSRDTTYCNVLDTTKPPCNAYSFQHEPEAVSLFCPGYFSESVESGVGSKICLEPVSSWKFRTIEDYKTTISTKTPSDLLALSCQTKDTDELCKDMEMNCKKIEFPTKSKGLVTTTRDLVYGQLGIATCDRAYGLSNPLFFRLYATSYDTNGDEVPTFDKNRVCSASLPAGKTCDAYYQEFLDDLAAYDKKLLDKKDELMLTQYLKMNLDDMAAVLTPFFAKYLPAEPITYWTSPGNMSQGLTIFRKCEGGGFGKLYIPGGIFSSGGNKANCVMRRECEEITKSAEFTGFATWADADIQSVITNPATVAANKGKKVELTINGTCEANYKATSGAKPQRKCTVTYKADGSIGYTEWKLPIVNPCIPQ